VARIGDFDKDLNPEAWFDKTLAGGKQGWFDKTAIGGDESDLQSAHGGGNASATAAAPAPAAPAPPAAKTTRAHDRPLEWWQEAAKKSWAHPVGYTPSGAFKDRREARQNDQTKTSFTASSDGGDWFAAFNAKKEGQARVPMLPLDSNSNVVMLVPRNGLRDAAFSPQEENMLSHLKMSSLMRAAGGDPQPPSDLERILKPVLLIGAGALAVLVIQKVMTESKKFSSKGSSRRSGKRSGKLRAA